MKKSVKYRKILFALNRYISVFLLIAFVITCCMMLFISVMSNTLNIELTEANLNTAAKITFLNVIFLSIIYTVLNAVRIKLTVDKPVKIITEAAERITNGDFSVVIPKTKTDSENGFDKIIECFNKMAKELSGTETLRTDFIANVSHEIKTPLSVIQNYSVMLQQPDLTDEKRIEYSKAITASSQRLSSLITNILKLSKLENQQIFPENQRYNLGEQLCECLLDFENMWERKNIEIKTQIEEDVIVKTDAQMMALVWNNLFSNAIKFTDEGGQISLILKSEGKYATVEISDTGCGISREVGEHIFEKFYQGDTSHSSQGNGLGLALVKRIVDITESEISVESELGKGSTFTIKIKKAENEII